jgi:hypothetical protein
MNRQIGGRRLVTEVSEVEPLGEEGRYRLRDIFGMAADPGGGPGDKKMQLSWTGARSAFARQVREHVGTEVTATAAAIFADEEPAPG